MKRFLVALGMAGAVCMAQAQQSAEPIRIGLIAAFSGPFADYGKQIEGGMKTWLHQNGDTIAGRKVEILVRDTTGPAPEVAKRLAQELVVRDKVHFLAGFGLTPEALAVAPVATQAKTPMVIMNAATSVITMKSPYAVRFSHTLPQDSAPMGTWAAKNGIQRVYTLVADYGPGIDAEAAFSKTFKEGGGQIVDSVRVPLKNPEFAPFIQRIKDARPQAVFIFVPPGEHSIAFMKGFQERGLAKEGIRVIATGDLTDDHLLDAMGDPVLGIINTFHYSKAHDSPENKTFLKAFAETNPDGGRPNFMAGGGHANFTGDQAMELFKQMKFESPRGPIAIDPETRDIVQTVYVRRVERRDGHLYNIEFDSFPNVKDPGKPAQ